MRLFVIVVHFRLKTCREWIDSGSSINSFLTYSTHRGVAASFQKCYLEEKENLQSAQERALGNMPLVDKIRMWHVDEGDLDDPDTDFHDDSQLDDDSNSDYDLDSPHVSKYQEVVAKSCAYRWLLARLHREVNFTSLENKGMSSISTQIRQRLDCRPKLHLISRQRGPPICRTVFGSEWDPMAFVREQEYPEEPGEALEEALTLTGGLDDEAEAMACSEYLYRTWPLVGEDVMKLLKEVVRTDLGLPCSGMISIYTPCPVRLSH